MAKENPMLKVAEENGGVRVILTGSTDDVVSLFGHAACVVTQALWDTAKSMDLESRANSVLEILLAGVIGGTAQAIQEGKIGANAEPYFRKAIDEKMPTMGVEAEYFFSDDEEEEDEEAELAKMLKMVHQVAAKGQKACDDKDINGAVEALLKLGSLLTKAEKMKEQHK